MNTNPESNGDNYTGRKEGGGNEGRKGGWEEERIGRSNKRNERERRGRKGRERKGNIRQILP